MNIRVILKNEDQCNGCPCLRCVGCGYVCNLYQEWLKINVLKQKDKNLMIERLEKCKEENKCS